MASSSSILFDGSNDYITMGDEYDKDYDAEIVISCWFKAILPFSATGSLVSKYDGTNDIGYNLSLKSNGKLQFILAGSDSDYLEVETSAGVYADGYWHHVFLLYGGGDYASDVEMYVDAEGITLTEVEDSLNSSTTTNSSSFNIGAYDDGSAPFAGYIDEVSLYTTGLSLAEVAEVWNRGVPTNLNELGSASKMEAWWPLGDGDSYPTIYNQVYGDSTTMPTIPDVSASGNNGTAQNMDSTNIVVDVPRSSFTKYAINFNEGGTSNEFVSMGNNTSYNYDGAFTVSAWVKFTDTGTIVVASKRTGSTTYRGWAVYFDNGNLYFNMSNDEGSSTYVRKHTSATCHSGLWFHIAVVYSASTPSAAADISFYVNGVLQTSTVTDQDSLGSNTIQTTAELNIGSQNNGTNSFKGLITDVALYGAALSAANITWIYNSGLPRDLSGGPANLDHYWRLGNVHEVMSEKIQAWVWGSTKESTSISDASAYDNSGTMNNMDGTNVTTDTPGGISDYSCTFNGSDEWVLVTGSTHLDIEQESAFTLSGWVKTTATSGFLWGSGNDGTTERGVYMEIDTSGYPALCLVSNALSSSARYKIRCTTSIHDGNWHHVAAVCSKNDTNDYAHTFYIDGVARGHTTIWATLGGNSCTATEGFGVAGRGTLGDTLLNGQVDEVSMHTKKLSESEITAIYNSGAPVDLRGLSSSAPFLVIWLRMGDPYGLKGTSSNLDNTDKQGDAPGTAGWSTNSIALNDGVTNESISVGDVTELDFDIGEAFSISGWIKPEGLSQHPIINKWSHTSGPGWFLDYYLNSGTGNLRGYVQFSLDGSPSGIIEVYAGDRQQAMPFNEWMHIAVTYDGSNTAAGVKFYINGELWPTYERYDVAVPALLNSATALIGRRESSYYGTCKIDELTVWDEELTQTDITYLYNSGEPSDLAEHPSYANQVGWWRMGEARINGTLTNSSSDAITTEVPNGTGAYEGSDVDQYYLMRGWDTGGADWHHWKVENVPDDTGAEATGVDAPPGGGPLTTISVAMNWSPGE